MAEALQYLHEEKFMTHRDLHWGNWMILEDNTVKLIDFGLAMVLGKNGFSTDYWMPDCFAAPEIFNRKGGDLSVDIWYIAYTMFGIVHPQGFSPWYDGQFSPEGGVSSSNCGMVQRLKLRKGVLHRAMPESHAEYNHLFDRMLAQDPSKRADINEVVTILRGIKAALPESV
jgi:serine/threonine protein kinase